MFYTPQRNAFPDNVLLEEASYLFGEKKKTGRVGLSEGHGGRVVHTVWAQAGQGRASFQVGESPVKGTLSEDPVRGQWVSVHKVEGTEGTQQGL